MSDTSTTASRSLWLPAVAVAACGAIWGGYWYPLRLLADRGIGAGWVGLMFNAAAMVALLPLVWRERSFGRFREQALTGLILGTAFSFYSVSLVLTDVLHAVLLFYLTPVWSTLGGRLFLGHRLTAGRTVSILLGLAGMVAIFGGGQTIPLPRNAGDAITLAAGLLWALGTMRSYARPASSVAMPAFAFSVGGLLSSAVIVAVASGLAMPLADPGPLLPALPVIVILALVIYVPPNFLVLWAAQRIDAGRIGILLMTEVLVGAITAALFAGEPFGTADLLGTLLIVAAGLIEVTARR